MQHCKTFLKMQMKNFTFIVLVSPLDSRKAILNHVGGCVSRGVVLSLGCGSVCVGHCVLHNVTFFTVGDDHTIYGP